MAALLLVTLLGRFNEGSPPGEVHSPSSKNAVFAMACGYTAENLLHFVGSLRATGFKGTVRLGIDAFSDAPTLAFLRENGVEHDPRPCREMGDGNERGPIPQAVSRAESSNAPARRAVKRLSGNLNQIRWAFYHSWLRRGEFRFVWLLDARDVFFQADPFVGVKDELAFFTDSKWLLGFDTRRLGMCISPAVMSAMVKEHGPNVCGGTVFGPGHALGVFCKDMAKLLRRISANATEHRCWRNDQPFLNYQLSLRGLRSLGHHSDPRYGDVHLYTAFEDGANALNIKRYNRISHICPYLESIARQVRSNSSRGQLGVETYIPKENGDPIPILHKWPVCDATQGVVRTARLPPSRPAAPSARVG